MPKFKHRDRVLISAEFSGPHGGKTGVIFGQASAVPVSSPAPVADGQDIEGEKILYMYKVDLDDSDTETVDVWESELTLI